MSDLTQWVPTKSRTVFAVSIALVALSFVVVVLRFISRVWIRKRLSVDDWLILLAWVMALGLSIALCIGENHGLGSHKPMLHVTDVTNVKDLGTMRKARFTIVFLYNPILMTAKMSILFFYLNLFGSFKSLKLCIWITMSVVSIGGLVLTLLILFQCRPVSAAFSTNYIPPPKSHCLNSITILYASAPLNIITDLAILLLPMPALTALKLPKKKKIFLILLFAGGGFVVIVGVVRIYFLDRAVLSGTLDWDGSLSFMWSAIEVNVSIICASIPMLRRLIIILIPRPLNVSNHRTSNEQNYESERHDLDTNIEDCIQSTQSSGVPNLYTSQIAPAMLPINAPIKQVSKALILVITLFFLWGFVYGLLRVLRDQFQIHYKISTAQSLGLQVAYFGPYLFTPRFFSGVILKRYCFKATFITGLLLYTASTLIYWPAVILGSFPGYVVADVFAGFAIATLETAANPYVALVGPLGMGESRINFAQGFQAVGNICASLIQYRQNFSTSSKLPDKGVANMNWVFLAIIFFMISLAVTFYYFELPELKDSEFPTLETFNSHHFWLHEGAIGPGLAILTVFLYMGAQETINTFWKNYFTYIGIAPNKPTINFELLGIGLIAAGRFVASIALLWLCPRVILAGSVIGCVITSAFAITQTGRIAVAMLILNRLFQSSIFGTVFSMGLRGIGRHTRSVAVYLVTGLCGGAIFPNVYYAVAKSNGYGFAMCVPTILFSLCITFPLYCYVSPDQRYRFGGLIRGETVGQLKNVPSMMTELYHYALTKFDTKYVNRGESHERMV